jgi:hypothetical protein
MPQSGRVASTAERHGAEHPSTSTPRFPPPRKSTSQHHKLFNPILYIQRVNNLYISSSFYFGFNCNPNSTESPSQSHARLHPPRHSCPHLRRAGESPGLPDPFQVCLGEQKPRSPCLVMALQVGPLSTYLVEVTTKRLQNPYPVRMFPLRGARYCTYYIMAGRDRPTNPNHLQMGPAMEIYNSIEPWGHSISVLSIYPLAASPEP